MTVDDNAAYDKAAILDNQTVDPRQNETSMYCPACDGTQVEIADNGTCVDCGSAVVDLTSIMQAAEKRGAERTIAKIRAWAVTQRDMCIARRENTGSDVEAWCRWRGAEMATVALIAYLDGGLKEDRND